MPGICKKITMPNKIIKYILKNNKNKEYLDNILISIQLILLILEYAKITIMSIEDMLLNTIIIFSKINIISIDSFNDTKEIIRKGITFWIVANTKYIFGPILFSKEINHPCMGALPNFNPITKIIIDSIHVIFILYTVKNKYMADPHL